MAVASAVQHSTPIGKAAPSSSELTVDTPYCEKKLAAALARAKAAGIKIVPTAVLLAGGVCSTRAAAQKTLDGGAVLRDVIERELRLRPTENAMGE